MTRGAEGQDEKEGGDNEGGDDMEGGGNENQETRQVEGRITEQNHMDLLLIYLFIVYTCTQALVLTPYVWAFNTIFFELTRNIKVLSKTK